MKITLIQSDIVWADPRANGEKLRKALATDPGADLYVLPEMFSTGFNSIAEEKGATLGLMRELAALGNCAIAGSVAVREGESVYNRFYFVKPDGSEEHYDKHHLFANGGEDKLCVPGCSRKVV